MMSARLLTTSKKSGELQKEDGVPLEAHNPCEKASRNSRFSDLLDISLTHLAESAAINGYLHEAIHLKGCARLQDKLDTA